MKRILLLLTLVLTSFCYGQTMRSAHWYFGWESGLDFSTGLVNPDVNGKLTSIEGSSAISDLSGHLLFYSNGIRVWDRSHNIMPNGDGLDGDESSTQSSLIAPLPGNGSLYYLFTTVGFGPVSSGFYYSIVDMRLNGGLGDVTATKNKQLLSSGTEQLAGTRHCNGTDYWIMTREMVAGVLRFNAYLLTKDGLSDPVVSDFPEAANATWNTVGTISFSQDGSLMAFTSFGTPVYLFTFNTLTGRLSKRLSLSGAATEAYYGNALSPDNSKLYITSYDNTGFNYLSQFDLAATDVKASRVNLDSIDFRFGSPNGFPFIGQIRLASDQQIYVSRWKEGNYGDVNPDTYYTLDSIDVIRLPNLPGRTANFMRDFLFLHGKPTMLGLPGFISNFTTDALPLACPLPVFGFTISGECVDGPVQCSYTGDPGFSDLSWDFGDPGSGAANSSPAQNPAHTYALPGEYTITCTVNYNGTLGQSQKVVRAGAAHVELGNDTSLCVIDVLTLNVPGSSNDIKWQDNSTASSFVVNQPGRYYVSLTQHNCPASDTIRVSYRQAPTFSLGPDLTLCSGETIILTPVMQDSSAADFLWQDGSHQLTYAVTAPGQYILNAANACGASSDSVNVTAGLCDLHVPSAFTPNGDGHNDLFKPGHAASITGYQLSVYNRWGQLVFLSKDPDTGWDGYWQGHRQPAGVYVWMIEYSSPRSGKKQLHGTLNLAL